MVPALWEHVSTPITERHDRMYSRSLEKYKRLEKLQKVDNIFIWEVWKNSIKISFEICTKG